MERLECRFYSLAEIHEIVGKERARDIKRILTLWGYGFDWKNREGVVITKCPETPMEKFNELAHRHLHIDSQIDPDAFACFLILLLEDESFSSMPWGERARVLSDTYGVDVTDRTLRNWASYLFEGEYLMKDKETQTVWCTEYISGIKIQSKVENPEEDEGYLAYKEARKEIFDALKESGVPSNRRYGQAAHQLWDKFHRYYYRCYTLATGVVNIDDLFELLRAAQMVDLE